jgi:hypothetical protein
MADQHAAERLELVGQRPQGVRLDHGRRARDLDDCLVQRDFAVERGCRIDHTVTPDHRGLDQVSDLHRNDKRDDASVREIDFVDWLVGLRDHVAEPEADRLQVLLEAPTSRECLPRLVSAAYHLLGRFPFSGNVRDRRHQALCS